MVMVKATPMATMTRGNRLSLVCEPTRPQSSEVAQVMDLLIDPHRESGAGRLSSTSLMDGTFDGSDRQSFLMVPELSLQLVIYLACVGGFTATAAITDLRIKKVPNKLTLPFFAAGLMYQLVFNGIGDGIGKPGLIDASAAFAVGFGLLWVLWMIGGGGGGDVKLIGALSVWIGFKPTCLVLALSTLFVILGSLGTIAVGVLSNGLFQSKEVYLGPGMASAAPTSPAAATEQRSKRRIMGYAPPVALATWLVVLWKLPKFPGF